MTLFFLLFAVSFTAFPVIFFVATIATSSNIPVEEEMESPVVAYILIGLFFVVGIIFWVITIKSLLGNVRSKVIAKEGQDGVGHFIRRTGLILINDRPFSKLEFSFKNNLGQIIQQKSLKLYPEEQVDYLAKIKDFKIKYLDDKAIIVEDLSDARITSSFFDKNKKNEEQTNSPTTTQNNSNNNENKVYTSNESLSKKDEPQVVSEYNYEFHGKKYVCKKCGYSQDKPGKCDMCGAKVK